MMQEIPPLPPGLSFTPPPQQGGVPPLPPGLSAAPPRQPAPARPAAPGMAPAPAAPVPSYAPGTAITGDDTPEQMAAKLRADGIAESEIEQIVSQYRAELGGNPAPAQPAMPGGDINQHISPNYFPDSAAALARGGPAYTGPGSSQDNPFILQNVEPGSEADYAQRRAVANLTTGMFVQQPGGEVSRLTGDPYTDENAANDQGMGGVMTRSRNLPDQARAFAMAAAEQIPFLDEAAVGTAGLISGRGYSDVRDSYQAIQTIDNQTNRGQRIAGGFAGAATGLVLPGSTYLKGSTGLLNASLRSAAIGAGYGGLYGAGADEGSITDRADGFVGGVIGGGLIGGATPGAVNLGRSVLSRVAPGLLNDAAGIYTPRGAGPDVVPNVAPDAVPGGAAGVVDDGLVIPFQTAPEAAPAVGAIARPTRPETRVAGALRRALERDGMTPQQVLDNMAAAPDGQLPFQAGGENLLGLAETMANVPGAARRSIVAAAREQAESESNRVSGLLADRFGAQGNGWQALRERITTRGAEADAGMAAIADQAVPLDDASVLALRSKLSSPAVRSAAEEAIAELTPEGSAAANRLFGLGDTLLDGPAAASITVREAQDISYALNEAASRAFRGGFNSRGEALSTLSRTIRQNARTQVDGYDQWLKAFGDSSEVIDGQRVGQNIFARANERNAMSAAQLSERWAKWSAPARDAYRLGVGEAVLDRVRGQGGVTAMRKLLKDRELAARVRVAFDSEDAFVAFMKDAEDQVTLANSRGQVLAGSPSARRLAGQADLQQQGMDIAEGLEALSEIGSPVAMGRRAIKAVAQSLPKRDRSIIGDDELNGLLGSALSDPEAMTRLLNLMNADDALRERVRARSRQAGLLSIAASRATGAQAGQASGGLLSQ